MEWVNKIQDFYIMNARKRTTLQKLYENHSLTHLQIDDLKTAIAAFEIVPLAVYTPYLILMLKRCARANTAKNIVRATQISIVGFLICDPLSIYLS